MKLGIIGTNFISDHLIEAARRVPEIEPHAVLSRKEETGRAFAEKHGIPHVYTEMEDFLSSGVEAVYIATPNVCHKEQARAALLRGISVLSEKPMTLSLYDTEELFSVAEGTGAVLMEAMRPVHDPGWAAIMAHLDEIGILRSVHLEFCQYSSRYDKFRAGVVENAFNPALGNAAVMDIGVYPLHMAAYLFGRPLGVRSASVFLENGFEGAGNAILTYEGGFLLDVAWSKITQSKNPSVFLGEDGSITVDKISSPARIELCRRGEAPVLLPTSPEENNMEYELRAFLRAIGGDQATLSRTRDASVATAAVVDAVRFASGIRF
jgi:predicted dehydrogenase